MIGITYLRPSVVVMMLLAFGAPAAAQQHPIPVTGRTLEVQLASGAEARGELLDALDGRITLRSPGGDQTLDLADVASLRYQRHSFTTQKALTWVAIGAVVTGGAMTIACTSVEDASCGGVFLGVAASFGLVGGLFAAALGQSAWQDLPAQADFLSSYARFPQGAPAGFRQGR